MSLAILLVEDDRAVRNVVGRLLVREGFIVLSARSVEDARTLLARAGEGVSLVLTDMELPDGTGDDVAAAAHAVSPAIPIVRMTGVERFAGPGVLAKPFTAGELRRVLQLVLDPAPGDEGG